MLAHLKRRKQIIHVKYPMLDLDGRTDRAKNTKHPLPRKVSSCDVISCYPQRDLDGRTDRYGAATRLSCSTPAAAFTSPPRQGEKVKDGRRVVI